MYVTTSTAIHRNNNRFLFHQSNIVFETVLYFNVCCAGVGQVTCWLGWTASMQITIELRIDNKLVHLPFFLLTKPKPNPKKSLFSKQCKLNFHRIPQCLFIEYLDCFLKFIFKWMNSDIRIKQFYLKKKCKWWLAKKWKEDTNRIPKIGFWKYEWDWLEKKEITVRNFVNFLLR